MSTTQRTTNKPHIKVAVHKAIYRWAQPLVAGKVALDAGCGTAYGTDILAEVAERVVGVDIDQAEIEKASEIGSRKNVEFRVMDCEALDFPPNSFDVVFSNALMEYLTDYKAFLIGARRVLKPGGLCMCSTKNYDLSFKKLDGSPLYEGHIQEFNAARLRAALEQGFTNVRIYSEQMRPRVQAYMMNGRAMIIEHLLVKLNVKHRIPLTLRNYVRRLITGVSADEIAPEDFEIVLGEFSDCWYVIGCGSNPTLTVSNLLSADPDRSFS